MQHFDHDIFGATFLGRHF